MIGLLIATHGKMASGLINSVELIMGQQKNIDYLELYHETDIDGFGKDIVEKVKNLDQGKGVLILVDLFSASPYNQSVLNKVNMDTVRNRIVTGVNLPMLLETLALRDSQDSVEDLWKIAMTAGVEGIKEFETEFNSFKR